MYPIYMPLILPDPAQAYWSPVNKTGQSLTQVILDLMILFLNQREKLKNLVFLGEIFQT